MEKLNNYTEGKGLVFCLLYSQISLHAFPSFCMGLFMMTKRLWFLMNAKDVDGKTIKDKTKILERYKNGNFRIVGKRSISPGNWKRKRTMMLHHREVREFKEFYEWEGTYLEAVRAKGKEIKKSKGMFIESMQKYIG